MPDLLRHYGDLRDLRRTDPAAGARCTHLLRRAPEGRGGRDDRTSDRTRERGARSGCRAPGWCPCPPRPSSYTAAVERYLTGAGIAKSSPDLPDLADDVGVDARRRTGADRTRPPGREAPVFPVTTIDDPALPEVLAEMAAARADEMDADTVNRELSIARLGPNGEQDRCRAGDRVVRSAPPQAKAGLFPDSARR